MTHFPYSPSPIFAKASFKEGDHGGDDSFSIEQLMERERRLGEGTERHRFIIRALVKLLKSSNVQPLDTELASSTLTLMLRLVSLSGMAEEFLKVF